MSERKVLTKYYPWDFDPSDISKRRGPKATGPKIQTVRLMAPFAMRCTSCGEFIYRGRKFNSRKVTPQEERYLGIQIYFFHIKCTRCSSEIVFRTDPKNNNYAMVSGAVRNQEPWWNKGEEEETEDQRLDRLEREEAEAEGDEERDAMADLEAKNLDAQREMAAADALDAIRHRNARIQMAAKDGVDFSAAIMQTADEEKERQDREDEEAARMAFAVAKEKQLLQDLGMEEMDEIVEEDEHPTTSTSKPEAAIPSLPSSSSSATPTPVSATQSAKSADNSLANRIPLVDPAPAFKRTIKKKKDYSAMLGIKKKKPLV
ncbi:Coiled-coil domain-containing protein 94 [Ceratocystis fimbriata CBS 114723]|uniref:Splicing factor YJU2 n=1 Tax=Ceratocystis fimbriata CBS 114723 TaxID=1035309 RepID=A0A2C5XJP0_9PEZI|nr:Coiled-coil domain-containing protein 94 [Ceratocystis fimbriata CBS 114723]